MLLDVRTVAIQQNMTEHMTNNIETLLTDHDVAEILKVDRQTVRRMVDEGRLARLKIGKCVRYEPSAVADFIASCRDEN
jgi:excisionase family DNA binding protein